LWIGEKEFFEVRIKAPVFKLLPELDEQIGQPWRTAILFPVRMFGHIHTQYNAIKRCNKGNKQWSTNKVSIHTVLFVTFLFILNKICFPISQMNDFQLSGLILKQ